MSLTQPALKFSDSGDERLYFRKLTSLPQKTDNTVRLVDHKDYFTAIDEDADLIADAVYRTKTVIKESQNHRYVTISPQVFSNTVLKLLLVDNKSKLEIYAKGSLELLCVATPGNYEKLAIEYGINVDSMQALFSQPVVMALKQGKTGKIGCCLVNVMAKTIQLVEFTDNDVYLNLELIILLGGVQEVVGISTELEGKISQVFEKTEVVVSLVKPNTFSSFDVQDISKVCSAKEGVEILLGSKGIDQVDFTSSIQGIGALINYLDMDQGYTLSKYELLSFVKIDSSTVRALNLFPAGSGTTMSGNGGTTISSIFELLNKCRTSAGLRLLSQWLKQPLTDLKSIEDRQDLVELLVDETELRIFLKEFLGQVPDVKRLLKKISTGVIKASANENKKLEDVVRLYQMVVSLPELVASLESHKDNNSLLKEFWFQPILEYAEQLIKLQELVETTIDLLLMDLSSLMNDFNIRPEFDSSLIEVNEKLTGTLDEIKQCHIKAGEDLAVDVDKKLKLENHQQHGWCFRVTRTDSGVLRSSSASGYLELQTVKAGIFFTTNQMKKLSQKYVELTADYNLKQKSLIREILSIVLTYEEVLSQLSLVLAHMDVLNSFANTAIFAPIAYIRPKMHELGLASRKINLSKARHPILEAQDDLTFIGNDVHMSPKKSFSVITGPNMGGKSTYIRQVGVISLMAQLGSFIPAEETSEPAELPIFDAILSRVGAGDSQLKGLLTFMLEMLETSLILLTATSNSLIIIDELGRGTSTYDGFGLAWAISEHLVTQHCFTLFATHFHELTALAEAHNEVQNLHVVAHVEGTDDLTLMYKVEEGMSDKLFGVHVAEMVKFPPKIVNMAKRKVEELQNEESFTAKKLRSLPEQFKEGVNHIMEILKTWKEAAIGKEPTEAVSLLKGMVDGKYKDVIAKDTFIQEILSSL